MTDSRLRRLKTHLDSCSRRHVAALNVITDAIDNGDIEAKDVYRTTREHLEASRGRLDAAHSELLRLLQNRPNAEDDDDSPNEELSMSAATRRTRLDDLDRAGGVRKVVGRAGPPAPVAAGGGAHVVNHCRQVEIGRLKALWQ